MGYTGYVLSKKKKISSEMKLLSQTYQENLNCWTKQIEICIFEYGTFSSDSIENKVITTMKGGFYLRMGYDKQVK